MVWEVPCIKRGLLTESSEPGEEGLWRLKTEGVNLQVTKSNTIAHISPVTDTCSAYLLTGAVEV